MYHYFGLTLHVGVGILRTKEVDGQMANDDMRECLAP
jgi:hypothetical protein